MRLTSKGRYAVMAMADLAAHGGVSRAVPLQEISERQSISLSYLEQLFARLRRAGLVAGVRGPGGGYKLSRPPSEVPVAEVIAAVNEPMKATRCKEGAAKGCQGRQGRCLTHDLWSELGARMQGFLSSVSLADVVENRIRPHNSRIAAE